MSRRKILRRYPLTSGLVIINHRHTRHEWYVTRADRAGRLRRVILPPFRSAGAARLAAAYDHPP